MKRTMIKRWPTTSTRSASSKASRPSSEGSKPHQHTAKELTAITRSRIKKAERDERVDIGMALTPVKTYMGGFTRPSDVRTSNWWPGGAYHLKNKVYETPAEAAYESHTVFLLESRYAINFGVGRVPSHDHVIGVCRTRDLPAIMARYNSDRAPAAEMEKMDNARWPWRKNNKPTALKTSKWWEPGEDPREILKEFLNEEDVELLYRSYRDPSLLHDGEDSNEGMDPSSIRGQKAARKGMAKMALGGLPMEARPSELQARAFSSSAAAHSTPRSKPPRSPEEAELRYYIERKTASESAAEEKEQQGGLMPELSATIVTGEFRGTIAPRDEKVPVEVWVEGEGVHLHASGFVPPTSASFHADSGVVVDGLSVASLDSLVGEAEPATAGSAGDEGMHNTEASDEVKPAGKTPVTPPPSGDAPGFKRELHTGSVPVYFFPPLSAPRPFHSSAAAQSTPRSKPPRSPEEAELRYYIERKTASESAVEEKEQQGGLMPELSATIVTGEFRGTIAPRDEKVPVEVWVEGEGVHLHASGFVPPTSASFHADSGVVVDGLSVASLDSLVGEPEPATEGSAGDEGMRSTEASDEVKPAGKTPVTPPPSGAAPGFKRELHMASGSVPVYFFPPLSAPRPFHSSAAAQSPSRSKPPRTPEEAELRYYIERKAASETVAERKEQNGELMAELSATIITGDFPTTLAPREGKVPVEVFVEHPDGDVHLHASGFVPPTPAAVHAEVGVVVDGLTAATLEAEELLGTTRASDATTGDEGMHDTHASDEVKPAGKTPPTQPPTSSSSDGFKRAFHTSASARAQLADAPPHMTASAPPASPEAQSKEAQAKAALDLAELRWNVRQEYLPTLASEPFWRPLMTVTVPTRPMAVTIARLARALPRGLPYYASLSNEDRKCIASYSSRGRCLRLARVSQIAKETAELMAGYRGGFIGVRFNPQDPPRGVNGFGLEKPIPAEYRTIGVGFGDWSGRHGELMEDFVEEGKDIGNEPFEVFAFDQFGKRVDGKAWSEHAASEDGLLEDLNEDDVEADTVSRAALREAKKAAQRRVDADFPDNGSNERHRINMLKFYIRQEQEKVYEAGGKDLARQFAQRSNHVVAP